MYHFMVSEVRDPVYRHHFMVSEVLDDLDLLIHTKGIDARISTWFSLCHLDLKDLLSQGIVTYNN